MIKAITLFSLLVVPLGMTKQEKFIKEITPLIIEKSEKYETI